MSKIERGESAIVKYKCDRCGKGITGFFGTRLPLSRKNWGKAYKLCKKCRDSLIDWWGAVSFDVEGKKEDN